MLLYYLWLAIFLDFHSSRFPVLQTKGNRIVLTQYNFVFQFHQDLRLLIHMEQL